ncbi:MAG: tRNA (guanosine(46)-N7)-methyltransferase TrmB [Intestinimonas sp.]|jgi:tRNA (guanine-N7-)-methyltransferase|nr:tRNA (guanosine(46)-N7)-methyltransferase TrmB [Intestinimonas sp.]
MRMRKKPNLVPRMERCAEYLIRQPAEQWGHWRDLFASDCPLWLEFGCGKGRFTCGTAAAEPEALVVAVERVPDVMVIAMERAKAAGLPNVRFLDADVARLRDYFAPGEADRIYLNFCDPWPAARHAKRRLTHPDFLMLYRDVLRGGGQIYFKTDNHNLFEWSLFQFPKAGFKLSEVTRNLHEDGVRGIMTDYEEKFYNLGTPINRCVATKLPTAPLPVQAHTEREEKTPE